MRVRAVLLDALGTLLALEPPAPRLRRELAARGIAVDAATAERALREEIAYYRAHNLEGSDRARLAVLRRRCARVLQEALGDAAAAAPPGDVHDALLAALRFAAYPDVAPALEHLRAAGLRLVVVSNWDVSLHDRLAETGIAERVDGAIASAELGVGKPARAIFEHALTMAGAGAGAAVHVGDSPHEDVEGARAAGIAPILIARDGPPRPPQAIPTDTVSRDTVSRDTVSRDTVSRDTLSRDTVSRDTLSRDTVSGDTVSRKTVCVETISSLAELPRLVA